MHFSNSCAPTFATSSGHADSTGANIRVYPGIFLTMSPICISLAVMSSSGTTRTLCSVPELQKSILVYTHSRLVCEVRVIYYTCAFLYPQLNYKKYYGITIIFVSTYASLSIAKHRYASLSIAKHR